MRFIRCWLFALIINVPLLTELKSQFLFAEEGFTEIGAKECAACHSHPSPLYQRLGVTNFVRLEEASLWFARDKHAFAYQMVCQDAITDQEGADKASCCSPEMRASKQLAAKICDKLGWMPTDGNFEKQCLTCHAGLNHQTPLDMIDRNKLQFGVSCEACHGPGSTYTLRENHQQPSWRTKSHEEKTKLGMNDLTSASVTARVCYSCHIGELEKNRFVTHEMYAAGHPPLPPIDLQTFLDAMPPHWEPLRNKPYPSEKGEKPPASFALQDEYLKQRFGDENQAAWRDGFERTQRSMIGALVANEVGVKLTHAIAERDDLWLDFAAYDCLGCHHELKKDTPRFRPLGRTPGRPYPAAWWALEHNDFLTKPPESREDTAQTFLAAFDRVPFGDRNQLSSFKIDHFAELDRRSQTRMIEERKPMSEAQVRQWLAKLYQSRESMLDDYWVCKQTAWMFTIAIQELAARGKVDAKKSGEILNSLADELKLNIFTEQTASVMESQAAALELAKRYDAAKCRDWLAELVELINANPIGNNQTASLIEE